MTDSNSAAIVAERRIKISTLVPYGRWHSIGRSLNLSARELQIIQCLLDGEQDETIGQALGISTHTVHAHLRRLYKKLSITSRSQLVLRIFAEYLLVESAGRSGPQRL